MSIGRLSLDTPMFSEAELVSRAARGEAEAFGDLYERYLDTIYRYVYVRVGNAAEAEDLTETVFLKAWEALGRYDRQRNGHQHSDGGDLQFRAWLYRIAHNLIVDRYRTHKQEASLDGESERSSGEGEPESRVLADERTTHLARALAQLDPAQQQVVTLRFVAGLSHAETARVMGKSDGAVRVLQHRALAALRVLLGRGFDDE